MSVRFPRARFWWISLLGVGPIVLKLAWDWVMTTPLWDWLSWGAVITITLSVYAGFLLSEATNPRSQLRSWWREWRAAFEIAAVTTNHTLSEGERIEVWCRLRFIKAVQAPELTVRATQLLGNAATEPRP